MEILRATDLIDIPWKNGGGITRDIAAGRRGAQTAWRISRADVASDGAFSNFAGLTRILTVVSGAGMTLDTQDGQLHAAPWRPLRFDGGLAVTARLLDGPLTDLNLMFDPALCDGMAAVRHGPALAPLTPPRGGVIALHILAGRPVLDGETLNVADSAFVTAPADLVLATGDAALEITLDHRDQSAAITLCIAAR